MKKQGWTINLTYKKYKRKNERNFLVANCLLDISENIKKKEGKYYGIKKRVPRNIESA